MRFSLFLFIFCLVLSNVVSAATLCCVAAQEQQVEQMESVSMDEMPCHEASDNEPSGSPDISPDLNCECQGCFQFSHVIDGVFGSEVHNAIREFFYHDGFLSSDLDPIYYPPRFIS